MTAAGTRARRGPAGSQEPRWELVQLANGAQLVLAPMAGRESVAASMLVRVGSRWEIKRLAGVSHFLEHIVFKGTENFPTSRDVSQSIEGIGGVLNASTDKELTTFWAKVPGSHLELALRLLFDLAFAPRIVPDEVDRERNVVLEELHMYLDQPGDLVQMIYDDLLWAEHPLGRDPAGTAASLGRIGAVELAKHRAAYYVPDRVVVVLSGGFDPVRAQRLVERCFDEQPPGSGLRAGRHSDGGAPAPLGREPTVKVRKRRGEQVHVLLGVRCSSYLAPDRWALDVLNTVLGEGMSSRLFLELRERQALAYDVHSFASRHRDAGAFGVYIATQPEQVETAVLGALSEVGRLVRERLTDEELTRTKTQIEGRLRLQLESTSAMAEFLGHQAALIGSVMAPAEVIGAVRAVTAQEVQELAAALFLDQGWRLAAVGPGPTAEAGLAAISRGIAR
ncbi:MAG TPA: pitrilysin family protein [Candidatus Dormibacteraeota bacterium]